MSTFGLVAGTFQTASYRCCSHLGLLRFQYVCFIAPMPQGVCGQGTSKPAEVATCTQRCACAPTHRPPCRHVGSSVMIVASKHSDVVAPAGSSVGPRVYRYAPAVLLQLLMAVLCIVHSPRGLQAAEATQTPSTMEERVRALLPDLEASIARGMQA